MATVVRAGKPRGVSPSEGWTREFKELGADRVRSSLVGGTWDREKKAAARIWIETNDAVAWQQKRRGKDGESPSFILTLRNAKWWKYVGPVAGAAMGVGFLYQRFRGLF